VSDHYCKWVVMNERVINQDGAALRKHTQWSKVLFLMVFTLEIVASAFVAMYIALLFAIPSNVIKGIVMILAGIVGFALGTLVFWRFSIKFSRWRSASKR